MGSTTEEIPQEDEIVVFVTGFAPFRPQNPQNPAWLIAESLPPFLPPSAYPTTSILTSLPPVRIVVHPEPVKVAYKSVRALVPKLWEGKKIDYMIHIGMATGRKWYSIERRAHRDGYAMKDVDGELLAGGTFLSKEREGVELPKEIVSDIAVDDVCSRWRTSLPEHDLRVSEDAGRYLCDYIFYASLAHLWAREEEKRVLFFHVPIESDEETVKRGTEIAIELIRSIVQSGRMKKLVTGGSDAAPL